MLTAIISEYNLPYIALAINPENKSTLRNQFLSYLLYSQKKKKLKGKGKEKEKEKESVPPLTIMCNYLRTLDGKECPHWIPLSCVTKDNSYLEIADVAKHRIEPHWIDSNAFIHMMFTRSRYSKQMRGFIALYHIDYLPENLQVEFVLFFFLHNARVFEKKRGFLFDTQLRAPPVDRFLYFRIASPCDALALARIQVASWRTTYKGILPDNYLFRSEQMSVAYKLKKWGHILNTSVSGKHTILLCSYPCQILGYTTVAKARTYNFRKIGPNLPHLAKKHPEIAKWGNTLHAEMSTLYLAPYAPKRKGLGTMLFDKGYEFAKEKFGKANEKRESTSSSNSMERKIDEDGDVEMMSHRRNKEIILKKHCLMAVWCLWDNQVAVKFYQKRGCIIGADNCRAKFAGNYYRYTGLVFSDS